MNSMKASGLGFSHVLREAALHSAPQHEVKAQILTLRKPRSVAVSKACPELVEGSLAAVSLGSRKPQTQ